MSLFDRRLGLVEEPGQTGLDCTLSGVSLAGAPLLMMTGNGLAPRPPAEIEHLAKVAYGPGVDGRRLRAGLDVIAAALNRGDIGCAMIAALQLRLPALTSTAAESIARADGDFAKYSPDQPRDWRGRWTDGDDGGPSSTAAPNLAASATAQAAARIPASFRNTPLELPRSPTTPPPLPGARRIEFQGVWSRPRLYQGGEGPPEEEPPPPIGHNGPAGEPLEIEREPMLGANADAARLGWDVPGQTINGLYYPPTRFPRQMDGTPWPIVTIQAIRRILAQRPGKPSSMTIFVPIDGIGPMLIGSTIDKEMLTPPGYSVVELRGTPQANYGKKGETDHADRSVAEAMRLARTGDFSMIFFNSTVSTGTGRLVESLIRPDVFGVYKPGPNLNSPARWHASEIKSPGQRDGYRTEAELKLMGVKDVTYKVLVGRALERRAR